MRKEQIYIATMADDFRETSERYNTGIEIDHYCMASNMDEPAFPVVHAQVERILSGKVHAVLHAPFNELHPAAIDPRALELAERRLEEAYEVACSHGIHRMVVHSGYLPFVYFKKWHIKRSIAFWERFMRNKPEHFHIYIENVLEDEPYMLAEMFEALDQKNIHCCLDTGHANCMSDVPVEEWARALAPFIGHVHLHNNNGEHDLHASLDDGTANLARALEILELSERNGRQTTYTLECRKSMESYQWLESNGFIDSVS